MNPEWQIIRGLMVPPVAGDPIGDRVAIDIAAVGGVTNAVLVADRVKIHNPNAFIVGILPKGGGDLTPLLGKVDVMTHAPVEPWSYALEGMRRSWLEYRRDGKLPNIGNGPPGGVSRDAFAVTVLLSSRIDRGYANDHSSAPIDENEVIDGWLAGNLSYREAGNLLASCGFPQSAVKSFLDWTKVPKEPKDAGHRDVQRQERDNNVPARGEMSPLQSSTKPTSIVPRGASAELRRDMRPVDQHARDGQVAVRTISMSGETTSKYRQLRALAREAIRTSLLAVESTSDENAYSRRALEAKHEFNAVADPLTILDLLDALEADTVKP